MYLTGCILDLSRTFYFKKMVLVKTSPCPAGIAEKEGRHCSLPGGAQVQVFIVAFIVRVTLFANFYSLILFVYFLHVHRL